MGLPAMTLTSRQIERYSRQIIVPRVGGRAQQRLLGSRLLIAGDPDDIEPAILYMAGAGVGHIDIAASASPERIDAIAASASALNDDVAIAHLNNASAQPDVAMAIAGSAEAPAHISAIAARFASSRWVIARVDAPGRIAVMPSPPPCPRCADDGLMFAKPGPRAANSGVIAMAATVEAFKLLAGYSEDSQAVMVEFDGLDSHPRELRATPGCACAPTHPGCT
jgi:adenylyltransferase/sulfurtransferase